MPIRHRNKSKQGARLKARGSAKRRIVAYVSIVLPIVLVAGLASAGWWAWQRLHDSHTLPFHQVRIVGQLHHLNSDQLRQTVQQQIHGGFFSVDMPSIKKSLMNLQWVEDVALRRMPGVLIVTVHEQQPMAQWNDRYLINTKKQVFLAPDDAPSDLPILQGPDHSELQVLENYRQINSLLTSIHLQIAKLQLDLRHNWQLVLNNGIAVTIGREEILARVQRLVHNYPQLIGDRAAEVAHIDLRYQSHVAIEWKDSNFR